jgi:hypothetical protein
MGNAIDFLVEGADLNPLAFVFDLDGDGHLLLLK